MLWQEHTVPWRTLEPPRQAAADASDAGLGVCLGSENVAIITSKPSEIYLQELCTLRIAAILAPPDMQINCDNQALVHAITKGHGRAFPPMYSLAITLLAIKK